jgi:hypothetical protein
MGGVDRKRSSCLFRAPAPTILRYLQVQTDLKPNDEKNVSLYQIEKIWGDPHTNLDTT